MADPNGTNTIQGAELIIGTTPIVGGVNGDVLYVNNGILGQQAGGGGSGITVGSTTISGGTTSRLAYDNSGVFGEALLRYSAANLFLGDVDAAAPVAQLINVQNVVTGTSNTAGALLTINGSQGTGTGVGGSITFQVSQAGSTGTSQNILTPAFTLTGGAQLTANFFGNITTTSSSGSRSITATGLSISGNTGFIATSDIGAAEITARGSASGSTTPFNTNASMQVLSTAGLTGGIWITTSTNAPIVFVTGSNSNYANERMRILGSAASFIYGGPDAAAPGAVSFAMQNVLTGTSNTAGADATINLSQGTGTGIGGDYVVKAATAGSTGTTQNALAEILRIKASGGLLTKDYRVSKTGNYSVLALDTGTQFDNIGASGEVDFTLPTAAIGLKYGFIVKAAQVLKIIAGSSTIIAIGSSISASAGNIQANVAYASVQIEAISTTEWVATAVTGSWTVT